MSEFPLLSLDDPRWATYRDAYGDFFDAVPLIRLLHREGATKQFWARVWDDLFHQGDVGEATYALVPYLVDYQSRVSDIDEQLFHFCVTVDLERLGRETSPVPAEIEFSYARAWRLLPILGTNLLRRGAPEEAVMSVAAALALEAGHNVLARAYLEMGRDDALAYLKELNGFEIGADE